MHPNTLVDLFELKAELHSLKSTMSDDEKNVINVVPVINDEIKDLNSSEASPTIWSYYANLNHYHYSFL